MFDQQTRIQRTITSNRRKRLTTSSVWSSFRVTWLVRLSSSMLIVDTANARESNIYKGDIHLSSECERPVDASNTGPSVVAEVKNWQLAIWSDPSMSPRLRPSVEEGSTPLLVFSTPVDCRRFSLCRVRKDTKETRMSPVDPRWFHEHTDVLDTNIHLSRTPDLTRCTAECPLDDTRHRSQAWEERNIVDRSIESRREV